MTRRHPVTLRTRLGLALAGVAVITTALSGCTSSATSLDADTAAALQNGVMAVSVASAAGDFTTAQAGLGDVRATLAAAADRLSAARTAQIQTAIDLVDADLAAAIVASAPPVPAQTPAPAPVSTDDSEESDQPEDSEEPNNTEDADSTEDADNTDEPTTGPPADKPKKDKDNPGQCKKNDTCE